jgi:Kef-type K+ transport system membrane component KefB
MTLANLDPSKSPRHRPGRVTLGGLMIAVVISGLLFALVRVTTSEDRHASGTTIAVFAAFIPLALVLGVDWILARLAQTEADRSEPGDRGGPRVSGPGGRR